MTLTEENLMTEPILLTYRLETDLWRKFFEAHYAADPQLSHRYAWGGVCIVLGSLGLAGMFESPLAAGLLLLTGFFGVLSKPLLVLKSLRAAAHHPYHGQQIAVSISSEALSVRGETTGYSQPWDNFIGYRRVQPGFAFYHNPYSFFFIPEEVLSEQTETALLQILDHAHTVRELRVVVGHVLAGPARRSGQEPLSDVVLDRRRRDSREPRQFGHLYEVFV